jgi:hypothetical protein
MQEFSSLCCSFSDPPEGKVVTQTDIHLHTFMGRKQRASLWRGAEAKIATRRREGRAVDACSDVDDAGRVLRAGGMGDAQNNNARIAGAV